MLLFRCRLQHARVGQDDGLVLVRVRLPIDHDAVEMTRFQVLFLYIEVRARNAVVEDTLRNLQFRTLLLHRQEQLRELDVGLGHHHVLEEERDAGYQTGDDDERAHRLHQRDACRLDGSQLRALAQVAVCDQGRKKDGQRECLWHQSQAHIPEELCQYLQRQTLANQFVDISPQELHHQDEEADEKRSHEKQPELLSDKDV